MASPVLNEKVSRQLRLTLIIPPGEQSRQALERLCETGGRVFGPYSNGSTAFRV
jgi:hypothetical protein